MNRPPAVAVLGVSMVGTALALSAQCPELVSSANRAKLLDRRRASAPRANTPGRDIQHPSPATLMVDALRGRATTRHSTVSTVEAGGFVVTPCGATSGEVEEHV